MYPGAQDPATAGNPYGHPQQGMPFNQQPFYGGQPGAPPNPYAAHPGGYPQQQQQPGNPNLYAQQQHQPQQGYAGGPQPFMPGLQHQQQPYGGYQAGPSAPPHNMDPTLNMPTLSPMAFMAGSSLLSGGQHWGQSLVQRVQQRTGWLTGGVLNFYFNISLAYVMSKLLMLLAPYLRRWTYSRQPEQIQGGQKYRPPIVDVNAPDLYIPLVGLWAYTLLVCVISFSKGTFKPDLMYSTLWSASLAWGVHLLVARLLLRALMLPTSVAWVEVAAYTGYAFVPVCLSIVSGCAFGKTGYWCAYGYGSLCMAIFQVRTMKRIIFQEAGHYGRDMTLTNYMLLSLALFQFPYIFWLGLRV